MRSLLSPLLAALVAAAITAAVIEFVHQRDDDDGNLTASADRAAVRATPEARPQPGRSGPDTALVDGALRGDLDKLALRLTTIETRLSTLDRRPVAISTSAPAEDPVAALDEDPNARDFILSVVTEKQAAEEAERAEQVRAMVEDRLHERVSKMAAELGLSVHDEGVVYDVLLTENTRRTEFFDSIREQGFMPGSRDQIRDELSLLRSWKSDELARQLGPNLAEQVLAQDPSPWRRDRREPAGDGRRGNDRTN